MESERGVSASSSQAGTAIAGHELGPHRIRDRLCQNHPDVAHRLVVDAPPHGALDRRELLGPPRAPQRDADTRLIEHPAQRHVNDTLAEPLAGEPIEPVDRVQVLRKARQLEFRIVAAQIVAREPRVHVHAAGQQATHLPPM